VKIAGDDRKFGNERNLRAGKKKHFQAKTSTIYRAGGRGPKPRKGVPKIATRPDSNKTQKPKTKGGFGVGVAERDRLGKSCARRERGKGDPAPAGIRRNLMRCQSFPPKIKKKDRAGGKKNRGKEASLIEKTKVRFESAREAR